MRLLLLLVLLLLLTAGCAQKGERIVSPTLEPVPIPGKVRCPECGMFVSDYENWACQAILSSREVVFFDEPGDMFLYRQKHSGSILRIYCRDYYTQKWVSASEAYFVVNSVISTPMGFGIAVFSSREDAENFRREYSMGPATEVLTFEEVLRRGVKPP
ncbi:nitrous oxide reductase accessory protein NosL [Candidatus Pyrohabitans sp.]